MSPSHIVGQKSSITLPPKCGFTSISLVNHVLYERLPQQLAVLPNKGLPQLKLLQLLASVGASALHLLLLLLLLLLASQAHTDVLHDGVGRPGHFDRLQLPKLLEGRRTEARKKKPVAELHLGEEHLLSHLVQLVPRRPKALGLEESAGESTSVPPATKRHRGSH